MKDYPLLVTVECGLVEMEKSSKPIASCAITVTEGMNIKTNTSLVEKARKGGNGVFACKPSFRLSCL